MPARTPRGPARRGADRTLRPAADGAGGRPGPCRSVAKVVFATNWKAQAAHGGFYQALADGTYRKFGLDVTIRMGGPQVNNRPMLAAGRIDFLMTGNLLHSFDNVKNGVPYASVELRPAGRGSEGTLTLMVIAKSGIRQLVEALSDGC